MTLSTHSSQLTPPHRQLDSFAFNSRITPQHNTLTANHIAPVVPVGPHSALAIRMLITSLASRSPTSRRTLSYSCDALCDPDIKRAVCASTSRIQIPDSSYDVHSQCHLALQSFHNVLCEHLPMPKAQPRKAHITHATLPLIRVKRAALRKYSSLGHSLSEFVWDPDSPADWIFAIQPQRDQLK